MAPEDARDVLVSIIQDTAAKLSVSGWNEDGAPGIQSCDASRAGGVKFGYGYGAPQPDGDHLADAETVADYWGSLGMTVRIDTTSEPVVFGEGGQVQGLRFSTAPGDYYIAGTSLCVPGNADELRESEYGT